MANAQSHIDEVKRAVLVALDWRSTPESRQAATAFLESVKKGDVHILAEVGYALVRGQENQWGSEVRLYGFKMLQHLIRLRWEELNGPDEHLQMASMSLMMLEEIGKVQPAEQWALKSQAAALVAEVSRRGGVAMWNEILPRLFNHSHSSPRHAELVAMVLRWLPEDVTVHNEDLEGERRRQLLFGLTQTLPQTLPFLFKLLEMHFTATITLAAQNLQEDLVQREHAAAVTAILLAVIAFAEWAPVTALVEYRLVEACSALQQAPQFRLSSCEVLKLIAARRKPADETGNLFVLAMLNVFDALAQASEAYLMSMAQWTAALAGAMGTDASASVNEIDIEYGECLCEAMVALGLQNFQCIADDKIRADVYIRKMLGFLQLPIYALHSRALPLLLTLLRDALSVVTNKAESADLGTSVPAPPTITENGSSKEKKGVAYSLLTKDICAVLLEQGYQRLLVKNSESKTSDEDDFATTVDYSQYHGRLLELIRLLATLEPTLAVAKVAQEIDTNFVGDEFTKPFAQTLTPLQSTQVMLEVVMSGVPDSVLAAEAASPGELGRLFDIIFERLLRVAFKSPVMVELHGQFIDAMRPFLKHSKGKSYIEFAINKLFALLESLPILRMDEVSDITYGRGISRARLQVCTSFLRVAKGADCALLPHALDIANRMTTMEKEGHLSRGEVNLLGEALLIVGSAGGSGQQMQVLDWLLAPLRECWDQPEWQERYLSSPSGLVDLLSGNYQIFAIKSSTEGKSIHDQIWLVFHTVTFLERAYRRCGDIKKNRGPVVRDQTTSEDMDSSTMALSMSPLVAHLKWALPPLLKLLRCIHALWSESITPTLPSEVRGALAMGVPEMTALLGTALSSGSEDGTSQMEGSSGGMGTKEYEVRTWLKGIRDSGYNMLGIAAARLGGGFFDDADGRAAALATALVENIKFMEMHHVRQLVHSVIVFFVKACPPAQWGEYLGRLLSPVLVYGQSVLSVSWASLMREGAVKPPVNWPTTSAGIRANDGSSKAIKTEVILEKMLRDLTREYCNLLSVIASTTLSPRQLPAGEHVLGTEFIGSDSMLGFLMQHKEAALAALHIGIEALEWTDSEAVHKATPFCGAIVSMVSVLTDPELQEIVGQNMFLAAMRGLTLESNATAQAELIGLLREIYIRLSSHSQTPRQLLLCLHSVTPDVLAAFDKALEKTASIKEQRQLMKSLLLAAGGDELKALKAQKTMSVITNVTNRSLEREHRPPASVDPSPHEIASIFS
jgi:exportin-5